MRERVRGEAPGEAPPSQESWGHPKPGEHREVATIRALPTPTYWWEPTPRECSAPSCTLALLLSHYSEWLSPSEPPCFHL